MRDIVMLMQRTARGQGIDDLVSQCSRETLEGFMGYLGEVLNELQKAIKSRIKFIKEMRREFPADFETLKSFEGEEIDL